jgi:hypothetical protein
MLQLPVAVPIYLAGGPLNPAPQKNYFPGKDPSNSNLSTYLLQYLDSDQTLLLNQKSNKRKGCNQRRSAMLEARSKHCLSTTSAVPTT